ncbi:hypothetical protein L195_g052137 [Trifolium pratense]|uniref:Uncharacterized protein n=1 Tax=Trifolium pratense TaxID=57577 RepID=A0A2K3K3G9_TRIPR|nr:hypothetical protein L195_g052137 [Trifolium pratense]
MESVVGCCLNCVLFSILNLSHFLLDIESVQSLKLARETFPAHDLEGDDTTYERPKGNHENNMKDKLFKLMARITIRFPKLPIRQSHDHGE